MIKSYHRQNKQIWVNSEHINKYTSQEVGLDVGGKEIIYPYT